jgi:hypothetical protein
MPCAAQVFHPVTQEQFGAIAAKAAASDINLAGNSGEVSHSGFTITWAFDPASSTLTIQCTDHPFVVSCGTVNARIHDIVDAAQPPVGSPPPTTQP